MSAIGLAKDTITSWVSPILRYERHLSAFAMVAGFGVDSATFGRIDRPGAHLIFGSYLALAAVTIAAAHWLQTRVDQTRSHTAAAMSLAKQNETLNSEAATSADANGLSPSVE